MDSNHDLFEIKAGYRSRRGQNANLKTTDHAQRNVYEFARRMVIGARGVKSVLDWGCGTGFKLIDLFGKCDTLGVDVDYRLPTLQSRFPDRRWAIAPVPIDADLVICADVIEHLDDPRPLLESFRVGRWLHLVISTPERDLCRGRSDRGPPKNKWHTREWNREEFTRLLERYVGPVTSTRVLGKYNLVAVLDRDP